MECGGWDGVDDGVGWNRMRCSKNNNGCDANEIALSSQLSSTNRANTHDADSRETHVLIRQFLHMTIFLHGANL